MLHRLCTKADFLEERNCSREAKNALELLLLPLLFVCLFFPEHYFAFCHKCCVPARANGIMLQARAKTISFLK